MFEREKYDVLQAVRRFFGFAGKTGTPEEWLLREEGFGKLLIDLAGLRVILCGGTITSVFTGSKINDLDFYVEDAAAIPEVEALFFKYFPVKTFTSQNAMTFQRESPGRAYNIQLITRFTGSPAQIFKSFDFTVCQGAYKFCEQRFELAERFLADNAKKRLVFCGHSHYPICALYRTLKYRKKGYTVPGSTLMHIALAIVQLDIKSYKQLKEQLMGVDTMYLQGLLQGESYLDDLPVDYGKFVAEAFERINRYVYEQDEMDEQ